MVFLFFSFTTIAQNTKGDQVGRQSRETRFKSKPKKGKGKGIFAKRIRPQGKSKAARASQSGKTGKPLRPVYSSTPGQERGWTGDARGNRVKVRSSTGKTRNLYPQKGMFVHNPSTKPRDSQQRWRAVSTSRVKVRSSTGKIRNVYPQTGRFVNNPSRKPKSMQPVYSNKSDVARNAQSKSLQEPFKKKKRVKPASASRAYIAKRSINPYAGFWNRKQKSERAYIGDISGRRLRTKNFETHKPGLIQPTAPRTYGRKRLGDQPYKGPAMGRYVTATRTGRAWKGDVAGRKIRGRNFSSKGKLQAGQPVHPPRKVRDRYGDRPYKGIIPGGGYKSASQSGEKRTGKSPLPVKTPGIGAKGIGTYQGNIKGRKAFGTVGADYSGSIKARKPLKGGGSVSGRLWNNQGQAIQGKSPGIGARKIDTYQGNLRGRKTFDATGAGYAGSIKARKPLKGGGSVSGKLWNNEGRAIQGKAPGIGAKGVDTYAGNLKGRKTFETVGADYTGNIKARKPLKGGGSVSGKLWNNEGQAIQGKAPGIGVKRIDTYSGNIRGRKTFEAVGADYTGNIKTRKPAKGGGSISGKLWNNDEQPIAVRTPTNKAAQAGSYQGNIRVSKKEPSKEVGGFPGKHRMFDSKPSMRNQGEEFTGYVRLSRFKKDYVRNPNQSDDAINKARPDITTYKVDGLQVRVKEKDYRKKPNAADESMPGIPAGKNSIRASEYSKGLKMNWDYKRNPSSDAEALKVHETGRAFGKSNNYQGNIKMKKFEFFGKKELHPDAQFVKTNKNNVEDERSMLTNFKLWWARVFKKEETQPDHLKEKIRKPRYDKGEQGLWYD